MSGTHFFHRLLSGRPGLERPPSSTARVLQTSMIQIWNWVFKPATALLATGIACLAFAAALPDDAKSLQWPLSRLAAFGLAEGILVALWVAWHRPNVGSSD